MVVSPQIYAKGESGQILNTSSPANHGGTQYPAALRTLARDLSEASKAFNEADNRRAAWQLLSTALLFFPLVALMFVLAETHYGLALLLAIPAGGLLTRFFALQHDCGHGSFFTSRTANEMAGRFISVLTFTPYDYWRRSHAQHHAGSGNLDRRGIGDVDTLTVREFASLGFWGRLRYRRHPLVALFIGPPVYFLFLQRVMFNTRLGVAASLRSIAAHNAALIVVYGALIYAFGLVPVLQVVLPVVLVGAWIGGALFYVRHQFEGTLWDSLTSEVALLKQLPPHSAARVELAHLRHRHPSRASPVEPHSQLPPARVPQRTARPADHLAPLTLGQPSPPPASPSGPPANSSPSGSSKRNTVRRSDAPEQSTVLPLPLVGRAGVGVWWWSGKWSRQVWSGGTPP